MADRFSDRLRAIFNLFTPGQAATISILTSILFFVWHISSVVTMSSTSTLNEIAMEKQRAIGAETQLSLRIETTIALMAANESDIKTALTEMKADIRALTAASTPTSRR